VVKQGDIATIYIVHVSTVQQKNVVFHARRRIPA
jgi:hypothetical protein